VEREIICVVDPMCSWCWGFSPVIDEIAAACGDAAAISFIAGGLRPLTREPMSNGMKADIRHHWEDVGKASGQPFDFGFFRRDGFVYDTEPACRALVTGRTLAPAAQRPFLAALHRAFYAENRDVTDTAQLAEIAGGSGIATCSVAGSGSGAISPASSDSSTTASGSMDSTTSTGAISSGSTISTGASSTASSVSAGNPANGSADSSGSPSSPNLACKAARLSSFSCIRR